MSKKEKSNKCRVVVILGGKGGVGKTTAAASLTDFYRSKGVNVVVIDADMGNSKHGSLQHLVGCEKLDIRGVVGLDNLINKATSGAEIVLVDFGAGTIEELTRWVNDVGEALAAEGVSFTIASIITEELATADALIKCASLVRDAASYVIIENHGKGNVAGTLDIDSMKQFEDLAKPAHIKIEPLRADLAQELDRVGQTPKGANDEPKSEALKKADARIRLTAWVSKLHKQIENTDALLPL